MVICHTSSNTLGGRVGGVRCDSNMLAYIVTGIGWHSNMLPSRCG